MVHSSYRIHFRTSTCDFNALRRTAFLLDISMAECIRFLVSLPINIKNTLYVSQFSETKHAAPIVVYDNSSVRALYRQVHAWDYHYAQMTRALNKIEAKRFIAEDDVQELYSIACENLEEVDDTRAVLFENLESLPMVALDYARDGRLDRSVVVRLNEQTYTQVQKNAELLETTVSDYLRALLMFLPQLTRRSEDATLMLRDQQNSYLTFDITLFPVLTQAVRHLGYTYNRAVHALNTIHSYQFLNPYYSGALFKKACEMLEEIVEAKDELLDIARALPFMSAARLQPRFKPKPKPTSEDFYSWNVA